MGFPRYVINMEDSIPYLIPHRENQTKYETGYQRSKGLKLKTGRKRSYEVFWRPPTNIVITGISIGVGISEEQPHYLDYVHMYIDDELVFQRVNMKDIYEYKNFRVFRRVKENRMIKFVYTNRNKVEKEVWFHIDYFAPPLLFPLTVKCINIDNGIEIQRETYEISLGTHVFLAPQIENYILVSDKYYQWITIKKSQLGDKREIVFEYMAR